MSIVPPHLPAGSNGSSRSGNRVLTINGGSSSIKFAIFDPGSPPNRNLAGAVERVGLTDAFLRVSGGGRPDEQRPLPAADFDQAVVGLLDWLQGVGELGRVSAVGHRIVHGGPLHTDPHVVTPELIADLRGATPFAPAHLPNGIRLIEALARRLPGVPQVVCFDTAFHRDLPPVARTLRSRLLATPRSERMAYHTRDAQELSAWNAWFTSARARIAKSAPAPSPTTTAG